MELSLGYRWNWKAERNWKGEWCRSSVMTSFVKGMATLMFAWA